MGFDEQPNYDFYRGLFRNVYKREGFDKEEPCVDWIFLKRVINYIILNLFIAREIKKIRRKKTKRQLFSYTLVSQ